MSANQDAIPVPCPTCGVILTPEKRKSLALRDLERICGTMFNLMSVRFPLSEHTKDRLTSMGLEIEKLMESERKMP